MKIQITVHSNSQIESQQDGYPKNFFVPQFRKRKLTSFLLCQRQGVSGAKDLVSIAKVLLRF